MRAKDKRQEWWVVSKNGAVIVRSDRTLDRRCIKLHGPHATRDEAIAGWNEVLSLGGPRRPQDEVRG
jgi:hypothetical protein